MHVLFTKYDKLEVHTIYDYVHVRKLVIMSLSAVSQLPLVIQYVNDF